eukprot:1129282-Prorocentrum_minimum.AAC.8
MPLVSDSTPPRGSSEALRRGEGSAPSLVLRPPRLASFADVARAEQAKQAGSTPMPLQSRPP